MDTNTVLIKTDWKKSYKENKKNTFQYPRALTE